MLMENIKPKKKETELYRKAKTLAMKETLAKKKLNNMGGLDSSRMTDSFTGSKKSNYN